MSVVSTANLNGSLANRLLGSQTAYQLTQLWKAECQHGILPGTVASHCSENVTMIAFATTMNSVVIIALVKGVRSKLDTFTGEYSWYSLPERNITATAFAPSGHWLFLITTNAQIYSINISILMPIEVTWCLPSAQEMLPYSQSEISLICSGEKSDILSTPSCMICFSGNQAFPYLVYGNKKGRVVLVELSSSKTSVICKLKESIYKLEYASDAKSNPNLLISGALGGQWVLCDRPDFTFPPNDATFQNSTMTKLSEPKAFVIDLYQHCSFWATIHKDALELYNTCELRNAFMRIPLPPQTDHVCYSDQITFALSSTRAKLEFLLNPCVGLPESAGFLCALNCAEIPQNFGTFLSFTLQCGEASPSSLPVCVAAFQKTICLIQPVLSPSDICHALLKLYKNFSLASAYCSAINLNFDKLAGKSAEQLLQNQRWKAALETYQQLNWPKAEIVRRFSERGALLQLIEEVHIWLSACQRQKEYNELYEAVFQGLLAMVSTEEVPGGRGCFAKFISSYHCPAKYTCSIQLAALQRWNLLKTFVRAHSVPVETAMEACVNYQPHCRDNRYNSFVAYTSQLVAKLRPKAGQVLLAFFNLLDVLSGKMSTYWLEMLWKTMNLDAYHFPLVDQEHELNSDKFQTALKYHRLYLKLLCQMDEAICESCQQAGADDTPSERFVDSWSDTTIQPLATNSNSYCALTSNLDVRVYGAWSDHVDLIDRSFRQLVLRQVACGTSHALLLDNAGRVYALGRNDYGQVGLDVTSAWCNKATLLLPKEDVVEEPTKQIRCGSYHSVVLLVSGVAYAWGWNVHGQLGLGDTRDRSVASRVALGCPEANGSLVKDVQCGYGHTLFLTDSGVVLACGTNWKGQLGFDQSVRKMTIAQPLTIGRGGPVKMIACSLAINLALSYDHPEQLWQWGKSAAVQNSLNKEWKRAELPICQAQPSAEPILVDTKAIGDDPIAAIACGHSDYGLITKSGEFYTWKAHSSRARRPKTTKPSPAAAKARSMALSASNYMVLYDDGSLWAYGNVQNLHMSPRKNDQPVAVDDYEQQYFAVPASGASAYPSSWFAFINVLRRILRGCRLNLNILQDVYIGSYWSSLKFAMLLLLVGRVDLSFQMLKEHILSARCATELLPDVLCTYELYFNCCKNDTLLQATYLTNLIHFTEACATVPCVQTFFRHHRGLTANLFLSVATTSRSPAMLFDLLIGKSLMLKSVVNNNCTTVTIDSTMTNEEEENGDLLYYACGHNQRVDRLPTLAREYEENPSVRDVLPAGFVQKTLLGEFLANCRNTKLCFDCWVKISIEALVNDLF